MKKLKLMHVGIILLFAMVLIFAGSCKKREVNEKPQVFDSHIDGVAVAPLPYLEVKSPARTPSRSPAYEEKEQESLPATSSAAEPASEVIPSSPSSSTTTFDPNS